MNLISSMCLAGALMAPAVALAATTQVETAVVTPAPAELTKLELGSTVPETLSLRDLDGGTTTFKDLRGKIVLVHFWSYRCPAERHANPVFMKMEKLYAESKDVVMIGIASNQRELGTKPGADEEYKTSYTSLRKKRDKVGYKHKILADHGNVVSAMFQARSTPHCFVIDKKGVLRYSGALDDDPRGKKGKAATNYLVDAAKALLAGEDVAVNKTRPYG